MICLADNDIFKKLAICNLLDEALSALDVSHSEVLVLHADLSLVLGQFGIKKGQTSYNYHIKN